MQLFPDSWHVEINEKEERILHCLYLAIQETGFEGGIFTQGTGFGFLLKEFRIKDLGEIYVYGIGGKTAIEINMTEKNREGFRKILKIFLEKFGRKPYGLLDFQSKKRWRQVLD